MTSARILEQKCVEDLTEKTNHYWNQIEADFMGTLRAVVAMPSDTISQLSYRSLAGLIEQEVMKFIEAKEAKTEEAKTGTEEKEKLQKKALIAFLYERLTVNAEKFKKFKEKEETVRADHLMSFLNGVISRRKKKGTFFEHSDALIVFLREAWKDSNPVEVKQIELTKSKYTTVQLLKKSLEDIDEDGHERSDGQKITAYNITLNHPNNTKVLSAHRDSHFDKFLLSIVAIMTGIGMIVAAAYLACKAKNRYSNYGAFNLFHPESQNMMDGANSTINEYTAAKKR